MRRRAILTWIGGAAALAALPLCPPATAGYRRRWPRSRAANSTEYRRIPADQGNHYPFPRVVRSRIAALSRAAGALCGGFASGVGSGDDFSRAAAADRWPG